MPNESPAFLGLLCFPATELVTGVVLGLVLVAVFSLLFFLVLVSHFHCRDLALQCFQLLLVGLDRASVARLAAGLLTAVVLLDPQSLLLLLHSILVAFRQRIKVGIVTGEDHASFISDSACWRWASSMTSHAACLAVRDKIRRLLCFSTKTVGDKVVGYKRWSSVVQIVGNLQ